MRAGAGDQRASRSRGVGVGADDGSADGVGADDGSVIGDGNASGDADGTPPTPEDGAGVADGVDV
jgi:hypothetical protein